MKIHCILFSFHFLNASINIFHCYYFGPNLCLIWLFLRFPKGLRLKRQRSASSQRVASKLLGFFLFVFSILRVNPIYYLFLLSDQLLSSNCCHKWQKTIAIHFHFWCQVCERGVRSQRRLFFLSLSPGGAQVQESGRVFCAVHREVQPRRRRVWAEDERVLPGQLLPLRPRQAAAVFLVALAPPSR